MSQEYTITDVGNPREWKSKRGDTFLAYEIRLEGVDGPVEWSRKPSSDPPKIGDTTPPGDIQNGPHGPKLQIDWDAVKGSSGGFSSTTSSGSQNHSQKKWQPESERDPERSARILRQHSQEMSLRVLALVGLDDEASAIQASLREWADWFDNDVNEAGQAARSAQGSSPVARTGGTVSPGASGPEPTSPPAEDLKDLEMAIDTAQPTPAKARELIARYMLSELPADEQNRACNQLCNTADLETQAKTIKALRERTEKWTGKPLPTGPKDDDEPLPF